MSSINVRLAVVGTIFCSSDKSYRLFKAGYTGAIIVCALAILVMIYTNNAQLSLVATICVVIGVNMAITIPVSMRMKRVCNSDAEVDDVSYLPVTYLGSFVLLNMVFFYKTYLNYAAI